MIFVMGVSVILLAVMGTSVRHVASGVFALLFVLSLSVIIYWPKIFSALTTLEKLFMLSFALYTLSGLLSYFNVNDIDSYIKLLERYFRFLIAIPIFLLMVNKGKSLINYLYIGAAISGPFVFYMAISHYLQNPDVPAKGYYHHIIFGQLAMVNVGLMIVYLITNELRTVVRSCILGSIMLGLVAVILSQARGVWIVFPVYLVIVAAYLFRNGRLRLKPVIALIVLSVVIVSVTPLGSMLEQRTSKAYDEVSQFYNEGRYASSVGARLAMWGIAVDVWREHPMLGTGPGDFDDEVLKRKAAGEFKGMELHNSTHNIFVQALVGTGLLGLLTLLFNIAVMPLLLFVDKRNVDKTASLSGGIVVISFMIFGISESWILRLSIVSVFLVYVLVILSHIHIVNNTEQDRSEGNVGLDN